MRNDILVSVVIPVYNTEKYLDDCINSVINQTYRNIEIIFVNDGSNDNSLNILKSYSNKDSRIKIINIVHKGVAYAKKTGIESSNGDYICCIDSDDYINNNYIKILLDKALTNNSDIVQCSFKCEEAKHDLYIYPNYSIDINDCCEILENWLDGNIYFGSQLCTKLFKANIIKGIFNNIETYINEGDDKLFFLYYLKEAKSISSTSDILYHYRYRYDSISHKINIKWLINEMIMINKLARIIEEEYPKLNKNKLIEWKNRYKKDRMHDYLNYKKTK